MEKVIPKLNSTLFGWQTWRGGTLYDLGIVCHRDHFIRNFKDILREYAVGYCRGESLACRPKLDTYAVMFCKGDLTFWTHFTSALFKEMFCDLE